jgi:hypothetical protein
VTKAACWPGVMAASGHYGAPCLKGNILPSLYASPRLRWNNHPELSRFEEKNFHRRLASRSATDVIMLKNRGRERHGRSYRSRLTKTGEIWRDLSFPGLSGRAD